MSQRRMFSPIPGTVPGTTDTMHPNASEKKHLTTRKNHSTNPFLSKWARPIAPQPQQSAEQKEADLPPRSPSRK